MTYYFWSKFRNGYVVYHGGMLQSSSYRTVDLLKADWPEAVAATHETLYRDVLIAA